MKHSLLALGRLVGDILGAIGDIALAPFQPLQSGGTGFTGLDRDLERLRAGLPSCSSAVDVGQQVTDQDRTGVNAENKTSGSSAHGRG